MELIWNFSEVELTATVHYSDSSKVADKCPTEQRIHNTYVVQSSHPLMCRIITFLSKHVRITVQINCRKCFHTLPCSVLQGSIQKKGVTVFSENNNSVVVFKRGNLETPVRRTSFMLSWNEMGNPTRILNRLYSRS
jgi:hypothetical protein